MNRKHTLALVAVLVLAAAALPALPKVAVLDAVIPANMDKSVIVPVTDKIAEEIVKSKQYSVLDRANVEQVLKEKEFQVSGMVQDSDIKQAGKYLGADFVVVARVSLVEGTYFLSAKMINVESGAVFAQVSDQEEGKASVLIKIAERVGKKLIGGVVEAVKEPEPKKTEAPKTTPEPVPAAKTTRPKSTIVVEVGLPSAGGAFGDATTSLVEEWYATYGDSYTTSNLSLGARASFYLLPFAYLGGALEHAQQMVSFYDSFLLQDKLLTTFSSTAFMVTAGYGRRKTGWARPGTAIAHPACASAWTWAWSSSSSSSSP
jgi:TolB-like protein